MIADIFHNTWARQNFMIKLFFCRARKLISHKNSTRSYCRACCALYQAARIGKFLCWFIFTNSRLDWWSGTNYFRIHFLPFTRDDRGSCPTYSILPIFVTNNLLVNFYFFPDSYPFCLFCQSYLSKSDSLSSMKYLFFCKTTSEFSR